MNNIELASTLHQSVDLLKEAADSLDGVCDCTECGGCFLAIEIRQWLVDNELVDA